MTHSDLLRVAPESKILLVGDLLIDKTIFVEVNKISPEAPVLVANILPGDNTIESPGGAGLAASFATKDNIPFIFLTAAPPYRVHWLKTLDIPTYSHPTEENVQKIRYIEKTSGYHLIRIDTDHEVAPPTLDEFSSLMSFQDQFRSILENNNISVVALLDYRKGVLINRTLTQWIIEECNKNNILTYTDSRSKDLTKFKGTTILKVNNKEFQIACGALNVSEPLSIISKLNIETLLITKGKDGAESHTQIPTTRGCATHSYVVDRSNIIGCVDVTGCGDVFDITFCYYWGVTNKSIEETLTLSVERATRFAHEPIGERLCPH